MELTWQPAATEGIAAAPPPDPRFPTGSVLDISDGRTPACVVGLPWPAPGRGTVTVECHDCGRLVAVCVAGQPDDPRQLTIACQPGAATHHPQAIADREKATPPFHAFIAATPNGTVLPATLRSDPDEVWRVLRASVTEPDALLERGWRVRRVACTPEMPE